MAQLSEIDSGITGTALRFRMMSWRCRR